MSVLTTASMDYAKSARFRGQSRRGNWLISIGKSAAERGSQIVHQDIRGQHVISAASEESNHITIVLLQSYRNDLCLLLLLFTFICFLHFFFFRIKLVYMYAMKLSFSVTKTKKVFSVLYIHNRFILQLSHLVNHVLIAPYRSLWCIIDWQIGGAYCTDIEIE